MSRKSLLLSVAAVAATCVCGRWCHAIEDDIVLGSEAEAARAASAYDWDIDKIRQSLEAGASEITYSGLPADGVVQGVPVAAELQNKTTEELFALCSHWNPKMLTVVSRELERRGPAVYDLVRANVDSGDPAVRTACATAIGSLLSSARGAGGRELVNDRLGDTTTMLASLCRDGEVQVRRAACGAYGQLTRMYRNSPEEAKLVMASLFLAVMRYNARETDPHLCQEVMNPANRHHLEQALPRGERAGILSKILLNQTFPRGAGATVAMISRLEEEEIVACLPPLVAHFEKPCLRDSMFFPGGRNTAFKLIAERRDERPDLFQQAIEAANEINQEAWVDLGGRHRGSMRVVWDTLGELGPEAKPALEGMRHLLEKAKAQLAIETDPESDKYKQIKERVDYAQSIIDRIEK